MKIVFNALLVMSMCAIGVSCKKNESYVSANNNTPSLHRGGLLFTPGEENGGIPVEHFPRARNLRSTPLPAAIDLASFMPPVMDQGYQGSCVTWAVNYAVNSYMQKYRNGNPPYSYTTATRMSPSYVYNQINGGIDNGSYVTDAFAILSEQGSCGLNDMPYVVSDYFSQPSQTARNNAKANKAASIIWLYNDVEMIKGILADSIPVILAVKGQDYDRVTKMGADGQYYWDSTLAVSEIGHLMAIVGYDDSRKAFKVQNSFGPGWANNGFIWYGYNLITKPVTAGVIAMFAPKKSYTESFEVSNMKINNVTGKDSITLYSNIPLNASCVVKNKSNIPYGITLKFTLRNNVRQFHYSYDDYTITYQYVYLSANSSQNISFTIPRDAVAPGKYTLRTEAYMPGNYGISTGYFLLNTDNNSTNPLPAKFSFLNN